ncbi:MAG: hypothetical protein CME11_07045 [Gemmatimonadetes bacterium]|nr:hypothetical protein [Gemmatimonadota bacterium]HAB30819.1 hypothetical protein [Gemmatimonadota bacterium]
MDVLTKPASDPEISFRGIHGRVPLTDRCLLELAQLISSHDGHPQIVTRKGNPPQGGANRYVGSQHHRDLDPRVQADEDSAQTLGDICHWHLGQGCPDPYSIAGPREQDRASDGPVGEFRSFVFARNILDVTPEHRDGRHGEAERRDPAGDAAEKCTTVVPLGQRVPPGLDSMGCGLAPHATMPHIRRRGQAVRPLATSAGQA